ncbi:MAG: hypothetical protein A2Y86_05265 [Candidatus Aminicenantes bacterium RBG_13_62_12]|nr:MAG: hypothetical protein A2Y86_05265 [Candidatus Aminicenantes bacterium RBG_13_62_12]
MTLMTAYAARTFLQKGEAKVASSFRHWSTGQLYVILDFGKSAAYTVLNAVWESLFKRDGFLKRGE